MKLDQIIEFGLAKLAIVFVASVVLTIYKLATQPIDNGWSTIAQESFGKRLLNRLRGRSSTSVEVRKDRLRVK